MKKILLILISCVLVFSFSACAGNSQGGEDCLVRIGSDSLSYVYNIDNRITSEYVSAKKLKEKNFGGDYSGNAVLFSTAGSGYQSSGYRIKSKMPKSKYDEITFNGKSRLYIWVCIVYSGEQPVTLTNYNSIAINENTRTFDKDKQSVWIQLKINVNKSLSDKLFDENGIPKEAVLFRTHFNMVETGERLEIYIGDIGLM